MVSYRTRFLSRIPKIQVHLPSLEQRSTQALPDSRSDVGWSPRIQLNNTFAGGWAGLSPRFAAETKRGAPAERVRETDTGVLVASSTMVRISGTASSWRPRRGITLALAEVLRCNGTDSPLTGCSGDLSEMDVTEIAGDGALNDSFFTTSLAR